jgi:hypothetical protein
VNLGEKFQDFSIFALIHTSISSDSDKDLPRKRVKFNERKTYEDDPNVFRDSLIDFLIFYMKYEIY